MKLTEALKSQSVKVTFTKADGSTREMLCTQDFTMIPTSKLPKQDSLPTARSSTATRVFDLEKQEWRSFRDDSVQTWAVC